MISTADLSKVYEWVSIPMWVFDKHQLRISWANRSALDFWDSSDIKELSNRDFSDITTTAMSRLNAVHRSALMGVSIEEQWTLYPRGNPRQVVLKSNVVTADDGTTHGILFCAPNLQAVPDSQLRGVQVLSYTATVVALYALNGSNLFRNPAASAAWDDLDTPQVCEAFRSTFVNPDDAAIITSRIAKNEHVFAEFKMLTARHGERMFELDCRPLVDPVDACLVIGISGRDITHYKQIQHERDTLRQTQLRLARAAAESEISPTTG